MHWANRHFMAVERNFHKSQTHNRLNGNRFNGSETESLIIKRIIKKEGTMKSHTEYIVFNTNKKRDLIRITDKVEEVVHKSGIKEGFVLVSAMHITAGVIVNDDEPGFHSDFWEWVEKLAPYRADYKHHLTGETNGDAHLKSILVHHQVILPITNGRLDLGPWQQVFYAEFDGQRPKRLIIKAIGE